VTTPAAPALTERAALMQSVVVALVISAIAVVGGLAVGSRIIVFDGVYGIIGLSLTWISLRASRAVESGPSARYPFGRESLTPFAIMLQGVAMLGTLLIAAVDAVVLILDGGSDVAPISVVIYGLLSAVVSGIFAAHLLRRSGGSELVRVEALQWRAGAVRNAVMVIGATVAVLIASTSFGGLVRFLDPVLVLVAVAMLAPIPIRFLRSGIYELLEGAPSPEVQQRVLAEVEAIRARHGLGDPYIRMTKLGRKLYLQIDIVVEPGTWTIEGQDAVRRELLAGLDTLGYELWASIDLTTDRSLAE
jgi:predicted Co/Zn/Cd cation transporter (cation efflux family)